MLLLLQGQGGAPPGDDGGDEDEMDKDELWASSSLQISAPHLKDTSSSAPWARSGDCRQEDRQVIKWFLKGCISKTRPSVDMMLFKCQYSQIWSKWRAEKTVLLLKGSEVLRLDMHCKQLNHIGIFTSWTFNLSIGDYHFSQKGPYYMDIIIGSL